MPATYKPTTLTDAIRRHAVGSLRRLLVEENGGDVILSGTLSSFYLKQLAQEALRPYLAGRRLLNRVEVVRN